MKTLKFFIFAAFVALSGAMVSCTDYQDEVDALDTRVKRLEDMVNTMQKRIDAIADIVDGMSDNWYITNYMPLVEDNQNVGYILNLRKDTFDPDTGQPIEELKQEKTIEIRNGEKGDSGQFPNISVAEGTDDEGRTVYYWVIVRPNGTKQPIVDENGNPAIIGQDGKDAISPKVRINPVTGEWETSVDGGETWASTGVKAEGEKGETGQKGDKGLKGADADSAIVKIELVETADGKKLQLTTSGGTVFLLPYYQN